MKRGMFPLIQEATRILQTEGPAQEPVAPELTRPALPEGAPSRQRSRFGVSMPVGAPAPPHTPVQFRGPTVAPRHGRARKSDVPPGEFLTGSFSNRAGAREYKLYVPS